MQNTMTGKELFLILIVSCGYGGVTPFKGAELPCLKPLRDKDICKEVREGNDYDCNSKEIFGHPNYRTYDGTCNNLAHGVWGASNTPLKRLLNPMYEDEKNTPLGWSNPSIRYKGYTTPNPRDVTQKVLKSHNIKFDKIYTEFVMLWSQFLAHDTDLTEKDDPVCTTKCKQKSPYCFPIKPAVDDTRLHENECIPLTRSYRVCGTGTVSARQQINGITAYIDGSVIYGSSARRAEALRDFTAENGFLKVGDTVLSESPATKCLMPIASKSFKQDCSLAKNDTSGVGCYFAGDIRANEHLGLLAFQTVWLREHNRIAGVLKGMNPYWTGNETYHETRKIVGALLQHITYKHWLPIVVGKKGIGWLSNYEGYDSSVDASITNVFATSAFRFAHFMINPKVFRLYNHSDLASFETATGKLNLHEASFCPFRIKYEGGIDPVLRGAFGTPMKDISAHNILSEEITERFLALANDVAFDLGAMDIQRGRDHGLPAYNDWRQFCSKFVPEKEKIYATTYAETFNDLAYEISDDDIRESLKLLYGHPSNIDIHVAGLVEDLFDGGLMGPTFTCLFIEQMRRLRDGDRFWYENPGVFTTAQLEEIKKHSLARVLCDSGDNLGSIQDNVFVRASYPDGYKSCSQIPSMNLAHWRDTDNTDDSGSGSGSGPVSGLVDKFNT